MAMNKILVFLSRCIVFSAAITDARSLKAKSPKESSQSYNDSVGYHQTGKYIVFAEYNDTACKQLKNYHGYSLGICQPYPVPGLWWMNYAGTSVKETFLLYQFFTDDECTKPIDGNLAPGVPAIGYEHWSNGCNNRTDWSKTFKVQDTLPPFSGGPLIASYATEEACKANQVDGSTGFILAKKNQCSILEGFSML